jgi:hypothetical protein
VSIGGLYSQPPCPVDSIFKRLNDAYAKYPDNSALKGAIVGYAGHVHPHAFIDRSPSVLAKMCYDKILRDKLLHKGALSTLQGRYLMS